MPAAPAACWNVTPPRDRKAEPRVGLIEPPGNITPVTPCPHRGELDPAGDPVVCLVCDRSNLDGKHPGLVIKPGELPKPEPKVEVQPPELTRAQKRKLLAELVDQQRKDAKRDKRQARLYTQAQLDRFRAGLDRWIHNIGA